MEIDELTNKRGGSNLTAFVSTFDAAVITPDVTNTLPVRASVVPGGCIEGYLTPIGYEQSKALGRYLADRYVAGAGAEPAPGALLGAQFAPQQVWAHTTPYQHSFNTLGGVLSGLFPAAAARGAAFGAYTTNLTYEYGFSGGLYCPASTLVYKENLAQTLKRRK